MDNISKAQIAHEIFGRLSASTDDRLRHGLRLRQEMAEQMERGEKPTGYRAEWLQATAVRVISEMGEAAREFNETHTDDLVSANDMLDVLATAINLLRCASSKG